jgi:hypothetical protein
MIKVDVEGYEAEVFRGARAVLDSPVLKAVITEGQKPADIAPLLSAGFAQYEYRFSGCLVALPVTDPAITRYFFGIHHSLSLD